MKKLFQEDVDPVCDELRASGVPMKAINGSLVWTKLGSVGSRSTAYVMVRDWKERRADRSVVQPLVGRRDLIAAVERIASGELDVERQATATENAALHDEVDALRQECDDLVKAIAELESISVRQTEVIGALGVEVDELKEQLQSAVLEGKVLAAYRERLMLIHGGGQSAVTLKRDQEDRTEEADDAPGLFDHLRE